MIRTVVISGGIGSGKSTVCRYLSSKGVPVYDSDSRTKALYDSDKALQKQLTELFGDGIFTADGSLDRKALASVIFSSKTNLERLEAVVHPAVLRDFISWRDSQEMGLEENWQGYTEKPFVVMESAIVLDKPLFAGYYDAAVVVECPENIRSERTQKRDNATKSEVEHRIRNQKIDTSKATKIIVNDSTLDELYAKTDIVFKSLSL